MTSSAALDTARQHRREGRFDTALEVALSVLAQEAAHVDALALAGVLSLELNRVDEAIRYLTSATTLAPRADTLNDLAVAHLAAKNYEQSLTHILAASALDPENPKTQVAQTVIESQYATALTAATDPGDPLKQYKFSIIMPHFDGCVSDEYLLRALHHLEAQTYRDFEVLLYHDGHLSRPFPSFAGLNYRLRVTITDRRYNDWGHSLRDMGIVAAQGEYILHHNADNLLYPNALEEIEKLTHPNAYPVGRLPDGAIWNAGPELIVFPIYQVGWLCNGKLNARFRAQGAEVLRIILTGFPPILRHIDAMQLVMTRNRWLQHGGWYDKSFDSDGKLYPAFIEQHNARYVSTILGEHW